MNKPLAPPLASIVELPVFPGICIPAMSSDDASLHRSILALRRLRNGWRPGERLLAHSRRAERWTATRQDSNAYQFVGFSSNEAGITSTIIATALAIDPEARWALLFPDKWVALGAPSPAQPPLDLADVMRRAEAWLRQTP